MSKGVYKCIKNVYNMGIDCLKRSGWSSPESVYTSSSTRGAGYIHTVFPIFPTSIHQLYTQQKIPASLLKRVHLYTESTAPTIIRTKEN